MEKHKYTLRGNWVLIDRTPSAVLFWTGDGWSADVDNATIYDKWNADTLPPNVKWNLIYINEAGERFFTQSDCEKAEAA